MECEKASRDRHWSEIEVDEKVERMRREVKRLQRRFEEIVTITHQLLGHVHVDGELAYKNSALGGPGVQVLKGDETYF